VFYVPILGLFETDALVGTSYNVSFVTNEATVNVDAFISDTFIFEKAIGKDGQEFKRMLINDTFNLVDGYDSTQHAYIQINQPQRLAQLTTIWNNWINTWPSMFSSKLVTLGTEKGINVLASVGMTRYWTPSDGVNRLKKMKSVKKFYDARLEKKKFLVENVYTGRYASDVSSQSVVLSAPWEQVQSIWILPSMQMNTSGPGQKFTFLTRIQALLGEPYSIPTSSGTDGLQLSMMHSTYASKMVKGRTAPQNDWDRFFEEMAAKGRGGILSGLAATFIGNTFGSTAGAIASAVADVLPI